MHDLAPQAGGFQDVSLVHADDPAASLLGGAHGYPADALDLHDGVCLGIVRLGTVFALSAAPVAEVDAAGQLPDDEKIHALVHDIGSQRAFVRQNGVDLRGAQVREKPQRGADLQKSLLRADLRGQVIPLGAAHRAEKHGVGGEAPGLCLLRQGHARFVDGGAADEVFGEMEGMPEFFRRFFEDCHGAFHDLGADAVSLQQSNIVFHSLSPFSL